MHSSYLALYETGELQRRIQKLNTLMDSCVICPMKCRVIRSIGERGACKVGSQPVISSTGEHFGEEPPLVGWGGSGTIFLTYCNLECVFCQNYDISHQGQGREVTLDELSDVMTTLQRRGCHNINFVTPTHQITYIVSALPKAIENGLFIPLVYNCGGYESIETIRLLDGIFDIYMPDIKYGDNDAAETFSNTKNYVEMCSESVKEMHRQVGDLVVDTRGVAQKGLIVRHLVLPEDLAATGKVMEFISKEISPHSYVNVMDQYRPCYMAGEFPPFDRCITTREFEDAVSIARKAGLKRLAGVSE